ncbi:MAG: TIGR04283 family arsenosugar biosynthesis glycosyltransferase [Maritimibacter sp.]|nr:TIGR04283 family arsenosugar biosynthesis glycosyltransferase [Maritimibacter sp.]
MRAPVSVVIPTLDAAADLGPCLAALGEGLQAGLLRELVISDGGSTDATRAVADEAGAIWVSGPPGRGGQLGRGVAASEGDWLLVLHADTWLAPGWSEAVLAGIARGAPGYFRLRFRANGPAPAWVASWANLRARALGLPFGDQGLLVSRKDYDAAGGYPEIPLMEDLALARALPRPRALNATAETGAERYQAHGWLAQGAANLWRQARFLAGADPERLARGYRR